jgi:hypothetical protein
MGRLPVKRVLVTLGIFAAVIAVLIGYINKKGVEERGLIPVFQSSLPELKRDHVSFYFDGDWCKVLIYGERKVSQTIRASVPHEDCGTSLTGMTDFQAFSPADTELFTSLSDVYEGRQISVTVNFDKSGNIGKADFELTGFHSPGGYIFEPNYSALPPNTLQDEYERIDNNWYRHFQDAL